jgi:hypothetical protein
MWWGGKKCTKQETIHDLYMSLLQIIQWAYNICTKRGKERDIIEGCGVSRENVDKGKGEGGRRRRGAVRI